MKAAGCLLLIIVLIGSSRDLALGGGDLTYAELIAARERLTQKQVTVDGYFNVDTLDLSAKPGSPLEPVAIDLTKEQIRELKRKQLFRSGYVRIVGRFEYAGPSKVEGTIGTGPNRRTVISGPAGFRNAYSYQITKIEKFEPIQRREIGRKP
jgi:hypothetical protein